MGETFQQGAELQAMDLLQVNMDSVWDIEELIAYKEKLKDCILLLVSSILDRRPNISPIATAYITKLRERVEARLTHVLEVIDRIREQAAEPADEPTVPRKAGAVHAPKR